MALSRHGLWVNRHGLWVNRHAGRPEYSLTGIHLWSSGRSARGGFAVREVLDELVAEWRQGKSTAVGTVVST
ncbi:MAG: hypothetical protein ACRDRF_18280, partial [Pseudonocardiaceae bacterium]